MSKNTSTNFSNKGKKIPNKVNSKKISGNSNNSLMHSIEIETQTQNTSTSSQSSSENNNKTFSALIFSQKEVLSATALVTIYSVDKKPYTIKALFDSGSRTSFISQELAQKLGFKQYNTNLNITGISDSFK